MTRIKYQAELDEKCELAMEKVDRASAELVELEAEQALRTRGI